MIVFGKCLRDCLFSNVRRIPTQIQKYSDVPDHLVEVDAPSKKTKQFLNAHPVMVEKLKTRSVLSISGPDSITFLNRLTTNELSPLKTDATCLHTFFLNAKGRIIHDALIYRPDEEDTLFVECDIATLQALQTHLIMFRSKTQVEIRDVEQEVGVWTVYDPMEPEEGTKSCNEVEKRDTSFLDDLDLGDDVLLSRDPRMWQLGVRILAPKDVDIGAAMKFAGVRMVEPPNGTYKSVRYRLGVAEGKSEIGFGRSLPAEINGDHTNAISLAKSNYIGWSPSGYKKVVDHRMLPLIFQGNTSTVAVHSEITDRKGKKRKPIGYLRGLQNTCGLGLMHLPSVMTDRCCLVGKILAECVRPPWWKNEVKASTDELKTVSQ